MQSLNKQQRTYSLSSIKNIVEDESLTFAEKAVNIKSTQHDASQTHLNAGDIAVVKADLAMAQDSTGPLAIRSLNEMRVDRLYDASKVLLVIDHTFPAGDEKVANLHTMIREFSSKHGCQLVEGSISHQHILEYLASPGMMILGADSHTCQAGCVGAFATGIGSTELAAVWTTGELWLRIPETIRIKLSGNFKKGVFARDLILDYIKNVGEDGANYIALEWLFSDSNLRKSFSIDSRACISNASMECGAKISVFPSDDLTRKYLEENPRSWNNEVLSVDIQSGRSAKYIDEVEIECNRIDPMVSGPDHVDAVNSIDEMKGIEIDQAFIGSSTNGRIEDLRNRCPYIKRKKSTQKY